MTAQLAGAGALTASVHPFFSAQGRTTTAMRNSSTAVSEEHRNGSAYRHSVAAVTGGNRIGQV